MARRSVRERDGDRARKAADSARPAAATRIAWLLLALATIAAYSNTLHGPFVFDDVHNIVENTSLCRLWPLWQPFLVESEEGTCLHNRPVVAFSLAVNYATGGLETFYYHLTNLAIHVLAGLTLFGIVRRTLGLPRLSPRYGTAATPLAFTVAAIWMLHPLQTGAVTYVIQRYESMMGLFYLLALYCAIRSDGSPHARWWAAASVGACLLALGSKEVAVSAPLVILLYDRAFLAGSFKECWRRRWGMYAGLAGTWLAFGLWFHFSDSRSSWAGYGLEVSAVDYARSQFAVILHYLRLSVWPYPQVFDYGWPVAHTFLEVLPGVVVVGGLLMVSVYALIRWPMWGVLGAWFFLILAPTSSVMPIVDLAFEHRMYLSLAAVAVAVVIAGYELLERLSVRLRIREGANDLFHVVPALVVIVSLGGMTYIRNEVYQTDLSVWRDVVDKAPHNARAHSNLARSLADLGKLDEALAHCRKEVELRPQYAEARNNLGVTLFSLGKTDEAIAQYRKALELRPQYAQAHSNLGTALFAQGKVDEAVFHYQKALEIRPQCLEACRSLAVILNGRGKTEEAIALYRKALQVQPSLAEARLDLGKVLSAQGRVREAVIQWQEAVRLRPQEAVGLDLLAWVLATCPEESLRDGRQAVDLARRAVRISRGQAPELLDTLAAAYAEVGRFPEAAATAQRALELASSRGNTKLANSIRARVNLYRSGSAFRDTRPPAGASSEKPHK